MSQFHFVKKKNAYFITENALVYDTLTFIWAQKAKWVINSSIRKNIMSYLCSLNVPPRP